MFVIETISNIGKNLFDNGSLKHSTNDIQHGNFKAYGEIAVASLVQGGPPPCILEEKVYDCLVQDRDIDFTGASLEQHLTPSEVELLDQIERNVPESQDIIRDHRYTGIINEEIYL